jgi:hypothetical protein
MHNAEDFRVSGVLKNNTTPSRLRRATPPNLRASGRRGNFAAKNMSLVKNIICTRKFLLLKRRITPDPKVGREVVELVPFNRTVTPISPNP